MLKRMTKVTSLLVCAASIMSIVPAMAAEVKTIETQEGTIYGAASKGKNIYIDAEINGKNEAQYYISEDGKYHELSGVETGLTVNDLLHDKYVEFNDKDTYLDITDNYKVVDTDRTNFIDDVETTLRKKIRDDNDGRFLESDYEGSNIQHMSGKTSDLLSGGSGLSVISYNLKNLGPNGNKSKSAIYTDYDGKYVDADYNLGSLKITTTFGSVTLKNTEDTYEVTKDGKTYEYKAELSEPTSYKGYITESSGSVYRWANLVIYGKEKSETYWNNITCSVKFGGAENKINTTKDKQYTSNRDNMEYVTVLHKFTRTTPATDDIDGIKYAKDANIYFVTDDAGKSESILGKSDSDAVASLTKASISAAPKGSTKLIFGKSGIYSVYLDKTNKKLHLEYLQLKSKQGFNYIDIGDHKSIDTDMTSIQKASEIVWVLSNGYIKTWDPISESFTKLYKVDAGMTDMVMLSKDNLIIWNKDNESYSFIHNDIVKDKTDIITTTGAGANVTTGYTKPTTSSWVKVADGTWTYNKADGTKAIGWIKDESTWYYLNVNGVMQIGWINDNGTWYYCNESGAMISNTTVDGYLLGENGAWIK